MEVEGLTHAPEAEKTQVEYLDIIDDAENFTHLKEQVTKSDGVVRVFIHPFFLYLDHPYFEFNS